MKKYIASAIAAVGLAFLPVSSQAVTTELAIVIDGSGSISAANFSTQQGAYHAALDALIPARFGDIALGVWQFSTGVQLEIGMTMINNQADLDLVTAAIDAMTQLNGFTAIGDGIATAHAALLASGLGLDRQVIDVSTDGGNNTGSSPHTAADTAIDAGIEAVNGLGIGGGADLTWVPTDKSPDSFGITATTFADVESALRTKLGRELQIPTPDAGSTLALLGLGLLSLVGLRRKIS